MISVLYLNASVTNLYGHSSPRLHSPLTQNEQTWGRFLLQQGAVRANFDNSSDFCDVSLPRAPTGPTWPVCCCSVISRSIFCRWYSRLTSVFGRVVSNLSAASRTCEKPCWLIAYNFSLKVYESVKIGLFSTLYNRKTRFIFNARLCRRQKLLIVDL